LNLNVVRLAVLKKTLSDNPVDESDLERVNKLSQPAYVAELIFSLIELRVASRSFSLIKKSTPQSGNLEVMTQ
jgi:hypothetical protein